MAGDSIVVGALLEALLERFSKRDWNFAKSDAFRPDLIRGPRTAPTAFLEALRQKKVPAPQGDRDFFIFGGVDGTRT
ncbi:MAG: hypothetical protein KAJ57_12750, partial [Woeseiaceae bacterium]|nr:hypothetical protein [Woeseiaceae bacterium]